MSNRNCLEGISCPECGSDGPFDIACTAVFRFTDEGTEDYNDVEWTKNSTILCVMCNWMGEVADAMVQDALHN